MADFIAYDGHEMDEPLVTSPDEWLIFMKSPMWLDFVNFFKGKIELANDDITSVDPTMAHKISALQAEIKFSHLVLSLPDTFIEWREAQTEEDNQAKNERRY